MAEEIAGGIELGSIKQNQAENFKKNYVSEMKLVINYLESKIKTGENLSEDEAEEAKNIICDNLNKFKAL